MNAIEKGLSEGRPGVAARAADPPPRLRSGILGKYQVGSHPVQGGRPDTRNPQHVLKIAVRTVLQDLPGQGFTNAWQGFKRCLIGVIGIDAFPQQRFDAVLDRIAPRR